MSLLIKNVEMPTDHSLWIVVHADGTVEANEVSQGRPRPSGWQTLQHSAVPVPPHGRLVDMDTIEERIDSCCNDIDCSKIMCNECAVQVVMNKVFDAPTIIPAESITAEEEKNDK